MSSNFYTGVSISAIFLKKDQNQPMRRQDMQPEIDGQRRKMADRGTALPMTIGHKSDTNQGIAELKVICNQVPPNKLYALISQIARSRLATEGWACHSKMDERGTLIFIACPVWSLRNILGCLPYYYNVTVYLFRSRWTSQSEMGDQDMRRKWRSGASTTTQRGPPKAASWLGYYTAHLSALVSIDSVLFGFTIVIKATNFVSYGRSTADEQEIESISLTFGRAIERRLEIV